MNTGDDEWDITYYSDGYPGGVTRTTNSSSFITRTEVNACFDYWSSQLTADLDQVRGWEYDGAGWVDMGLMTFADALTNNYIDTIT